MHNNEIILTDEQVEEVVDTLKENRNDIDDLMIQIEEYHKNDDNSDAPLEEGIGRYISDGVIMGADEDDEFDFSHFDNIDNDIEDIIENNLKDTIASSYNISEEEALNFANVIFKVRNNEKLDIFNNLPQQIKDQIIKMAEDENIPIEQRSKYFQFASKMIIDEIIEDVQLNSLTIDLEKAMQEMMPSPSEMYSEANKEYIEEKFIEIAEKIKDEHPKQAENLLLMREGYIHAYTLEPMFEVLKDSKVLKNIRRCTTVWKRIESEYMSIAAKTKFKLYPLNEIETSLKFIGFNEIESKRIITLFVYTYTNGIKDYTNKDEIDSIYRNSFANYFESNIKNLAINEKLISEFSKNIKQNIVELSSNIEVAIVVKEAELSYKKDKKRR